MRRVIRLPKNDPVRRDAEMWAEIAGIRLKEAIERWAKELGVI